MAEKKYVAYVGTYTHGESRGIHIYDLDVENGRMEERKVVSINNPSYIRNPTMENICIPLRTRACALTGSFRTEIWKK